MVDGSNLVALLNDDICRFFTFARFGNTYLSFAQAESFHPIFGPMLMVIFAAMSNTLLVTILISILSNTFARIDANAIQEHLFQFALMTMEGVKGDALFSYQPPFNLLAYILLFPLSRLVSPRTLHRANVLLMRITSFPILLTIAVYERLFARGQKWRESSQDAGKSLMAILPKPIKHSALFEAIIGSNTKDLLEAIFSVDISGEPAFFDEETTDEVPMLRSYNSHEHIGRNTPAGGGASGSGTPVPRSPILLSPSSTTRRSRSRSAQPHIGDAVGADIFSQPSNGSLTSPLAKLFSRRPASEAFTSSHEVTTAAAVKKLERLVDGLKEIPYQQLKDEMKELQERQSRIENLLLTLTRGMRSDSIMSTTSGTRR